MISTVKLRCVWHATSKIWNFLNSTPSCSGMPVTLDDKSPPPYAAFSLRKSESTASERFQIGSASPSFSISMTLGSPATARPLASSIIFRGSDTICTSAVFPIAISISVWTRHGSLPKIDPSMIFRVSYLPMSEGSRLSRAATQTDREPQIDHTRERALVNDRVSAPLAVPSERLVEFDRHVDVDSLERVEVAVCHRRLLRRYVQLDLRIHAALAESTLSSVVAFAAENFAFGDARIVDEHFRIVSRVRQREDHARRLFDNLFASGDFHRALGIG